MAPRETLWWGRVTKRPRGLSLSGFSVNWKDAGIRVLNDGSPINASRRTSERAPAESGESVTARGYSVSLIGSRSGGGGSSLKMTLSPLVPARTRTLVWSSPRDPSQAVGAADAREPTRAMLAGTTSASLGPEQVLPYGLAEMLLITPSRWTLTEATREVRLPV
jgi:hypothetical protein